MKTNTYSVEECCLTCKHCKMKFVDVGNLDIDMEYRPYCRNIKVMLFDSKDKVTGIVPEHEYKNGCGYAVERCELIYWENHHKTFIDKVIIKIRMLFKMKYA